MILVGLQFDQQHELRGSLATTINQIAITFSMAMQVKQLLHFKNLKRLSMIQERYHHQYS